MNRAIPDTSVKTATLEGEPAIEGRDLTTQLRERYPYRWLISGHPIKAPHYYPSDEDAVAVDGRPFDGSFRAEPHLSYIDEADAMNPSDTSPVKL